MSNTSSRYETSSSVPSSHLSDGCHFAHSVAQHRLADDETVIGTPVVIDQKWVPSTYKHLMAACAAESSLVYPPSSIKPMPYELKNADNQSGVQLEESYYERIQIFIAQTLCFLQPLSIWHIRTELELSISIGAKTKDNATSSELIHMMPFSDLWRLISRVSSSKGTNNRYAVSFSKLSLVTVDPHLWASDCRALVTRKTEEYDPMRVYGEIASFSRMLFMSAKANKSRGVAVFLLASLLSTHWNCINPSVDADGADFGTWLMWKSIFQMAGSPSMPMPSMMNDIFNSEPLWTAMIIMIWNATRNDADASFKSSANFRTNETYRRMTKRQSKTALPPKMKMNAWASSVCEWMMGIIEKMATCIKRSNISFKWNECGYDACTLILNRGIDQCTTSDDIVLLMVNDIMSFISAVQNTNQFD